MDKCPVFQCVYYVAYQFSKYSILLLMFCFTAYKTRNWKTLLKDLNV